MKEQASLRISWCRETGSAMDGEILILVSRFDAPTNCDKLSIICFSEISTGKPRQYFQIPPDLVVKFQPIDIVRCYFIEVPAHVRRVSTGNQGLSCLNICGPSVYH
jgi:hypothetical protein